MSKSLVIAHRGANKYAPQNTLPAFKKAYELGDDVTLDTLYKDIRDVLDAKARDERIAQEQEDAARERDGKKTSSEKDEKESENDTDNADDESKDEADAE